MEQHPVPQPITSYEFRLVGDMTLKQFLKLAAGIVLALIVYAIDPPSLIKWFLIFLFTAIGLGMAFFPFEGRSIDTWIIAFFKRIYSPTQFVWRPKGKPLPLVPPAQSLKSPSVPAAPAVMKASPPVFSPPALPVSPPPLPVQFVSPPPVQPVSATIFKAPSRPVIPPPSAQARNRRVDATFVLNVVVPATPAGPNLLTGFIHDRQGKIIEGAILEIRDSSGSPVRAFKTNRLGQFLSATPLPSGLYEIETEKEGYQFDIIKIELKGAVLSPIEIVSK